MAFEHLLDLINQTLLFYLVIINSMTSLELLISLDSLLPSLCRSEILIENILWLVRYKGIVIFVIGWYGSGDSFMYI